ncbi:hypothetical protein DICVIV_10970 [Dictyocaulus viviparus]|uniref:AD domain-containing protein n=1 Tax=Dictyocaulus viviparus TaxID=29172 RepID=A0A0D8XH42_DICVI|nr:hypothetical protein DICVIV_10970 [Dictyocaulus viviparus]
MTLDPMKLIWIPREGYVSVGLVDESTSCCEQHSVELADMMGRMFGMRQTDDIDATEIEKRRDRLLAWLRANHVDVNECEDGSLLIFGVARIQSPFNQDSCYCDNAIILKRLRGLVSKVPE